MSVSQSQTIRKKVKSTVLDKRQPLKDLPREMSSTMRIPLEAVFDDISPGTTACLDISYPGRTSIKMPLGRETLAIGRAQDEDICLPLANVSRKHARLMCNSEEYVVEDLNSTNGTFVNNVRISRCILRNNDCIRIGEAKILFLQQRNQEQQ